MGSRSSKAQQEMVGFVLIVALVVVALMVFLVISLRSSQTADVVNGEVDPILVSMMRYTTDCATEFVPNFDSFKDLFKSCYRGLQCKNLGVSACEYLNTSLPSAMGALLNTTRFSSYRLDILEEDQSGRKGFMRFEKGSCQSAGSVSAAQQNIAQGGNALIIRLSVCG